MANRQYRRKSNGQFASRGDAGAKVTVGRAGGFASAAHRANVANSRAAARRRKALVRTGTKVAAGAAAGYVINKTVTKLANGVTKQLSGPGNGVPDAVFRARREAALNALDHVKAR